ncbi:Alpha/Beta hydrolase protein [Blyttiomyces helicus]|uniref:Alpha/Beta hydrolase protein n=1 Tax=Blyttiomyces helicus TaxID=388810 RepID=A0A4P9WUB8_9FUNG|nr:Alpha/Beta hydrolase protein [Blyttiomyces helicus]|eukprot:RKO94676.1 Alpha/Beta hydrolase protein [Blyttiomyces helicus]
MRFSSTISMAVLALSGALAAPARRDTPVPIRGDFTTRSGPVPADTVADIERFVGYAGAAYDNASSIASWTCTHCSLSPQLENITVIEGNRFLDSSIFELEQAFIGVDNERQTIVVSFRGTISTVVSWLNDFNALLVSDDYLPDGVLISQGFQKAYATVRSQIQATLPGYVSSNPGFSIAFTGHSLGGATSTLALADALDYLSGTVSPSDMYLVNYGSPRVGNTKFAHFINNANFGGIWRSANFHDAVPLAPINIFPLFDYKHVGVSAIGIDASANPPNPTFCGGDPSSECTFENLNPLTYQDNEIELTLRPLENLLPYRVLPALNAALAISESRHIDAYIPLHFSISLSHVMVAFGIAGPLQPLPQPSSPLVDPFS